MSERLQCDNPECSRNSQTWRGTGGSPRGWLRVVGRFPGAFKGPDWGGPNFPRYNLLPLDFCSFPCLARWARTIDREAA